MGLLVWPSVDRQNKCNLSPPLREDADDQFSAELGHTLSSILSHCFLTPRSHSQRLNMAFLVTLIHHKV